MITSILFIGIIVLVWHNVKSGRADLGGTAKFGLFYMLLGIVVNLFNYDHFFTSIQGFAVLTEILRRNLFVSLFLGLVYCAFEPFVRRWWSEYLISWSRLLAGDFRDPMVGRDILIGGVVACVNNFITLGIRLVNEFGLGEKREILTRASLFNNDSFLDGMTKLSSHLLEAVYISLGFLGISLIVHFFTRNKKATLILSGILYTAYLAIGGDTIVWVNWAIIISLVAIVFNRFGLVAIISVYFFGASIRFLPLTFDPASIVFPQTVATLVIYFAIMAYAAYISIGGAKLFGGKSFWGE